MLMINNKGEREELLSDPHILPAISLGASASKPMREKWLSN